MSYCRWSSDFFRCDVYVYQSREGWVTHVAGRRLKDGPPEELLAMPSGTDEEWIAVHRAEMEWRKSLEDDAGEIPKERWFYLRDIGPEAGESYTDATPGECAARLRALKAKGFNVPDYAIEALEKEERDQ